MLDELYKMVTPIASASKLQRMKNRLISCLANYIYPIYCRTTPVKQGHINTSGDTRTIISLTSYPARINTIHLCINSLIRQTLPADLLILWLAKSQFPTRDALPLQLRRLESLGLQIRYCDDIRSYKKIFYVAQEYPNSIIITADDDTLYPESWLYGLMDTHRKYKNCVCCYRAHKIVTEDGSIAEYKKWIGLSPNEKGPSSDLIPIGVGGVLYPAGFFSDVKFDIHLINQICPTADDLWLKAIGMVNNYKVVKVNANSKEWFTIKSTQKEKLMTENIEQNGNDISMKKLMEYYQIPIEKILTGGDKELPL